MSAYAFSESYVHSSPPTTSFSPGSSALASAYGDRIVVRSTETMQVVRTWICPDPSSVEKNGKQAGYGPRYTPGARAESRSTAVHPEITSLAWSPTSTHILATAVKQNLVYIFSTAEETDVPAAVIRAGLEGLTRCEWNENGEEVMCWSEGGVSRLAI